MNNYVAFLRGINVGKRRVAMSKLAAIFTELGHREVATYIASGNVVFGSGSKRVALLEEEASAALHSALGYEVEVFVRSAADLVTIARSRRFEDEEARGATINVGFMRHALDRRNQAAMEALHTADDSFRVVEREFYWICHTKISQSRVWALPEATALVLPQCTLRNMSTIRQLVTKFLCRNPPGPALTSDQTT